MRLAEALVQEFDLEASFTRKVLERVPEDRFDWKPHEKSMTLGWLATFSALIYTWGVDAMERDSFDPVAAREASQGPPRPIAKTREDILKLFDQNIAALRAAILKQTDEHLATHWTLLARGQKVFSEPRWLVLRTYVLNHAIHHRGQLTVYLRLLGVAVPAIYNDSADERGGMFVENPPSW